MRDRINFDKGPDFKSNNAMMGPAGCSTGFVGVNKNLQEAQLRLAKWHVENNAKMLSRIGQCSIYGHTQGPPPGEQQLLRFTAPAWSAANPNSARGAAAQQVMAATAPPATGRVETSEAKKDITPRRTPPGSASGSAASARSASKAADTAAAPDRTPPRKMKATPDLAEATAADLGAAKSKTPTPPGSKSGSRASGSGGSRTPSKGTQLKMEATPGVDLLIDGLRRRMHANGLESIIKIKDFWAKIDKDNSGSLSLEEFQEGLVRAQVLKSPSEALLIFNHFDVDKSGTIAWNEFLNCIRGQLPEARRKVVHEAFANLDADGSGILTVEDLMKHYKSYQHPDVIAGIRTEEELFDEMLRSFDTINQDGQISLSEFELYYEDVSGLIDRDDFFEMMIRNCWHLEGAQGGHCTRLHITLGVDEKRGDRASVRSGFSRAFSSGIGQTIQETVEIRPDIGLNKQDPDFFNECRRRLADLGYEDVERIEVLGRY